MKYFFFHSFFLFLSVISFGQTPEDITKRFFTDFASNSSKAIDEIYKTNPHSADLTEAINTMKEVAKNYPKNLGKYHGYELITQEKITNSFILLTYMVRFDRQPMRFTFIYYKPSNEWNLYSLNFSANLDEELEQIAKIIETKD
ncbi:MAG: hypothetical protein JNJ52_01300 [Flavobacterium sp.]|nr:hypothetical protein [Flavobacterium sp.]